MLNADWNFDIIVGKLNKRDLILKGIGVKNNLDVELVPQSAKAGTSQMPLINFIKVLREDSDEKGKQLAYETN